jgi:hypothetical protein
VAVLGCVQLAIIIGGAVALLPLLVFEIAAILVLPRTLPVRRFLDRHTRRRAHERAIVLRQRLHTLMEGSHQKQLIELEHRVAAIRVHAAAHSDAMLSLIDESLGLDRLLATYVRLSVALRVARESLAFTDPDQLADTIRLVQRVRDHSPSPRLRDQSDRRLGLLRQRMMWYERGSLRCELMAQAAASVADMCHLVLERSSAMFGSGDAAAEVERIAGELECHDAILDALATNDDPWFDPCASPPLREIHAVPAAASYS